MSVVLLLVLVVPLSAAIVTVVTHVDDVVGWAKNMRDYQLPPPPAWLASLPLVGARAVELWNEVAVEGFKVLAVKITPYAGGVTSWFVSQIGSLGAVFLQFVLTVVAAAVLYANGESAADLSLLLIFIGVIGGLISFGLIGIVIGPLVLAVTHTLLSAWLYADTGVRPKSNTGGGTPSAN